MKLTTVGALASLFILSTRLHAEQATVDDTNWCLSSQADSTLYDDSKMENFHPICAGLYAGTSILPGGARDVILGGLQRDWAQRAVVLACSGGLQNFQTAIGIIAACQCHSDSAFYRVLRDGNTVISTLRARGCEFQNNILPMR